MSFGLYLTGFVVVIAGLIYGACLMHVPTHWIVVGGLVLVGLGILTELRTTGSGPASRLEDPRFGHAGEGGSERVGRRRRAGRSHCDWRPANEAGEAVQGHRDVLSRAGYS